MNFDFHGAQLYCNLDHTFTVLVFSSAVVRHNSIKFVIVRFCDFRCDFAIFVILAVV